MTFRTERLRTDFIRAGLQPDGTLIQRISRKIDGEWRPPLQGEITTCQQGPFQVEQVVAVFQLPDGSRYFRAEGQILDSR